MRIRGIPVGLSIPFDILLSGKDVIEIRPSNLKEITDLRGQKYYFISQGFIDIQVNGFAGIDFNSQNINAEDLEKVCLSLAKYGVTTFFPTIITGSRHHMLGCIKTVESATRLSSLVNEMVKGIHMEGPYISPEDGPRGAHSLKYARNPDWEEFSELEEAAQGLIKYITLAPELPGAIDFIKRAVKSGIIVGIGHCNPMPDDIERAVDSGTKISTHLGNGSHAILPRHNNYIQKQLACDNLYASIIADGHHLPDYFVKNLIRAKSAEKVIAVTDAMAAAGSPEGLYKLRDQEVEVKDRIVKLPGTPYLAGSSLTMDRAISNIAKFAQIPLKMAIEMATLNPAKLFQFKNMEEPCRKGSRADFVIFEYDGEIKVKQTIVGGELVYSSE